MTDVLAGPGGGAEPTIFMNEDDTLMMIIGMVDTPGGLGLYEHAFFYCPFCGTALQDAAEVNANARN